jgi:hypothetical protein
MSNRIGTPKPTRNVVTPGGRPVIRPMYGVFIRDNLAKFRREIQGTIDMTKEAIKDGSPRGKEIFGDGILQGKELTKAKAAVKDLEKAVKALKPVFPGLGPAPTVNPAPRGGGTIGGRPGGVAIAMYGVVFRDDLSRFRSAISDTIGDIKAGMSSLKPAERTEAKKALASLQAALKDLGTAGRNWN